MTWTPWTRPDTGYYRRLDGDVFGEGLHSSIVRYSAGHCASCCWTSWLDNWLYPRGKRASSRSSLVCSQALQALVASLQGSGRGVSYLTRLPSSMCSDNTFPAHGLPCRGPGVLWLRRPAPLISCPWPFRSLYPCSGNLAADSAQPVLASVVPALLRPRFEVSSPGVRCSVAATLHLLGSAPLPRFEESSSDAIPSLAPLDCSVYRQAVHSGPVLAVLLERSLP